MTKYNIERFDAIINVKNNTLPMFYIKPDLDLLKFFKNNKNVVSCQIDDTQTIYDGKIITGIVNTNNSSIPNFFEETGLCTISLWSDWHGYPKYGSKGTVVFSGLK